MASEGGAGRKVEEMLSLLRAVGFPLEKKTPKMQKRLARVMLAVCNLKPETSWADAAIWDGESGWRVKSRDIIKFLNQHYGESIADSSYDDIRRGNLDYLVQAGLVLNSAGRPDSNVNDGTRGYAVHERAANVIRSFGSDSWTVSVQTFIEFKGRFEDVLERKRARPKLIVRMPDGLNLSLKAGAHNSLQKAIIEEFVSRFVQSAEILYVGDSDNKDLYKNAARLRDLGVFEIGHDRLPDVIVYDAARKWLFFIEAVHTSNPMSSLRHVVLERASEKCTVGIVYVSAFADRRAFAAWVKDIGWETEVWLADSPEHLIHFNGDRFLGPHERPGRH